MSNVKKFQKKNDQKVDYEAQYAAMEKDYFAKMDMLEQGVIGTFDSLAAKFCAVGGLVSVQKTADLFDEWIPWTIAQKMCRELHELVLVMKADWEMTEHHYLVADTFLDKYVDADFVSNWEGGVNELVKELAICDICQALWEPIRRIPEFDAAAQNAFDELIAAWVDAPAD